MKHTQLVIYGNFMFLIDRYIYESEEMFYFRINYIYRNIKNYKQSNIDELIGLSKLESQKYFNNCGYLT